jgi:hypothetical protein
MPQAVWNSISSYGQPPTAGGFASAGTATVLWAFSPTAASNWVITLRPANVYQERFRGERRKISARYVLREDRIELELDRYDTSRPGRG